MSLISVIIPFYNEANNVAALYDRLTAVARELQNEEFEFVFTDDGSTDKTFVALVQLADNDPRVKLIKLARNFGEHAALAACLKWATGDCAIRLSADFQDPPDLIPELVAKWKEGSDVVWAERLNRDDPLIARMGSSLFVWVMNKVLLPRGFCLPRADVFLADRKVISVVSGLHDQNAPISGLIAWVGFRQTSIGYHRQARRAGRSGYTLGKKIKLAIDSGISLSYVPIRLMPMLGIVFGLSGLTWGIFILLRRLLLGSPLLGWGSLMATVLTLSGIQFLVLGVLGEYLWRTLEEARGRPRFIIDRTVNIESEKREKQAT